MLPDSYKTIQPSEISTGAFHSLMLSAIAPRPIAFVSTINNKGEVNLSPYSFFNCFGSKPPIIVFSPAVRVRDGSQKHTLLNVEQVGECVVNILNYAMVEQASLASSEYSEGVNEFVKAGFTEVPSQFIKPPRVGESPVSFECKVLQIIKTGTEGGAGNLVIAEILCMHIQEQLLVDGKLDSFNLDLVGRLGGDWYVRANPDALFTLPKPQNPPGIGFDALPLELRKTHLLNNRLLARLANISFLPTEEDANKQVRNKNIEIPSTTADRIVTARPYIEENDLITAWSILISSGEGKLN